MNRSRTTQILAWSLSLGLAASAAFGANHREAALGSGGELFQVRTGVYGELFPGGSEAVAENPVLALDVERPGEEPERILVPGTEAADVEGSPYILVEGSSNTVFLVWEIRIGAIHSILKLSSFDGSTWSTPIEVGKNSSSLKAAPQLAITRDAYRVRSENGDAIRHRTILHLVWAEEEGAADEYQTRYTPLVIEDGRHLGAVTVYDLNDFKGPGSSEAPRAEGWSSLIRTPTIESGRDARTVVVSFGDPETGRLITVEIDSLPAEISQFADPARAQIVDLGRRMAFPANLQAFANEVHKRVTQLGKEFQPEIVKAIADRVRDVVLEGGEKKKDVVFVGGEARAQIVDLGAKLSRRGLRGTQAMSTATATSASKITEVWTGPDQGPDRTPPHLIQFSLASNRPAPAVGSKDLRMFISESGEQLILAWLNAEGDHVLYRSTLGQGSEGWTPVRELPLNNGFDLQKAYEILQQRVRNH